MILTTRQMLFRGPDFPVVLSAAETLRIWQRKLPGHGEVGSSQNKPHIILKGRLLNLRHIRGLYELLLGTLVRSG